MTQQPTPTDRRTIPLLELITRESLDQDYQHVAAARAAQPGAARKPGRGVATGVAVVVLGLLVTLAAVQTSRNAPAEQADKAQLIDQVEAARAELSRLQQRIGTLQRSSTQMESTDRELSTDLDHLTGHTSVLSARTGFGAVTGDGVEVQVTDSPSGSQSGEVRDSDLAALTNGLWAAGATAISVNGHRLTALSALRNSGTVIRLDGDSLSPPYVVTALGDNRTLLARFAQTASGRSFHDVTSTYGMPTSSHDVSGVTLPAAPASMMSLSYARQQSAMSPKEQP